MSAIREIYVEAGAPAGGAGGRSDPLASREAARRAIRSPGSGHRQSRCRRSRSTSSPGEALGGEVRTEPEATEPTAGNPARGALEMIATGPSEAAGRYGNRVTRRMGA
jgi:hypothetical protein